VTGVRITRAAVHLSTPSARLPRGSQRLKGRPSRYAVVGRSSTNIRPGLQSPASGADLTHMTAHAPAVSRFAETGIGGMGAGGGIATRHIPARMSVAWIAGGTATPRPTWAISDRGAADVVHQERTSCTEGFVHTFPGHDFAAPSPASWAPCLAGIYAVEGIYQADNPT
jgi:hypothetical protein